MTGIEGIGWPVSPRGVSRAREKSGFMVPSEPDVAGHATAVAATQATPLASMLALQELGEETIEDREARRHSHVMLAMLAELQRALLGGSDEVDVLHRLADLAAAAAPAATDRRLAAMVSAIVLRVRVELARRQT
jgi:hypothetical protein